MESLSRPPHRRKHSTTANGFSFKNPYDGVLRSNGGERKSLEAHEYTEIFSGSCAIPVLDLSGLDEKAGSDDLRSSKLDYSNIFGGLRNDDVAVPYEELFNGSAKKSKPRMPADTFSPLQESGSLHPSGKTKRSSSDASDQSVDGVKQQFNVSFNRTNQRNNDASNGKTHIAQLHAVPGFTYFVDGSPQLRKTEKDRHAPSLKREVSRTWSFSAEVEAVKAKGGLSNEKSHTTDKTHNVSEVNLKSHFLRTPPPSSYPSHTSENKDPRRTKFASEEDVSEKIAGESSPPFFDEEFDENSVAAVSAAALKKAIDQAQESIRIAKMIMEKKKEGFRDGSKLGPGRHLKVLEKESKRNYQAREKCKEANPSNPVITLFTGIDAKSNPSLHQNATLVNAANVDMERVWENVEAAKEHGEAFAEGGKLFASDCSRSKTLYIDEKVEVEQLEEYVDAAETHTEATDFPGLVANAECRTMNLESVELGNNNSLMLSTGKHKSHLGGIDTGEENFRLFEATLYNRKEFDFVAEKVERAFSTSQRMQGVEKSVEEAGKCQATSDHAEWPENTVERVLNTSQGAREQEKVVDEAGEKLRICQDAEVSKDTENDMDDKGECEKQFEDSEEVVDVEHLTVLSSEFDKFLDESCNLIMNGNPEQEEVEKKSENVFELKENSHRQGKSYDEENKGVMQEEAHLWFESEEQLMEALEEEINETGPHAFPDTDEAEKKVNEVHEPEIDVKKQDHAHDEDEPNLPRQVEQNKVVERGKSSSEHEAAETTVIETNNYDEDEPDLSREVEQNKVVERGNNTSEHEAAKTIVMEANNYAEIEKSSFWNSRELNNTLRSQYQGTAYSEDIDEAVDVDTTDSSSVLNDAHTNDTSPIFSGPPEACDISLNNKSEEYQEVVKRYKENDAVPEVIGTFATIGNESGKLFHLQDNEMPGTGTLHRSASEEIFAESMQKAMEDLSSDGKMENAGIVDADTEKKQPEDDDAFKTGKTYEAAQEDDVKFDRYNLPEVHASDDGTAESDGEDTGEVLQHTSVTDKGSVSTSTLANIDGLSAQEDDVKINRQNVPKVHASENGTAESDGEDVGEVLQQTSETDKGSVLTSTLENIDGLSAHESEEFAEHLQEKTSNKEELVDELDKVSNGMKYEAERSEELIFQLHTEHKEIDKFSETERVAERGFNMEKNKENLACTSPIKEKDARQGLQNFDKNDHQQRIEAIKKGREREKDRMAVERAIREARERAFAEARERAERAAVERAAAEVRQRVLAEAREKLEKSSVKQPVDKATTEAKLRAERAAVERATAEARERALEKAMSQKTFTEARTQADRHPTERSSSSSSSSRNNGMKHSLSSSDLENGMNTESAQRRKARLERHQRIMERAAKALEEKNMRDMLAQKEQAERNRLAEFLDADIKRWAAGKEGNLRALLSTLQYILGTNSGWQPISLTEIITTAAVKKAYRRATLYVHPDKLQQRGASIQQKYICEKVFDLLKAAWNRFNSDER